MNYTKPPRTYEEQLAILKSRSLVITDRAIALHCLKHHNYYRLSAYRATLTKHGDLNHFIDNK